MCGWTRLGYHGVLFTNKLPFWQCCMMSSANRPSPELQPSQNPKRFQASTLPQSHTQVSQSLSLSILYPVVKSAGPEPLNSTAPKAGVGGLPLAIPRREKSHRQRVEPRHVTAKVGTSPTNRNSRTRRDPVFIRLRLFLFIIHASYLRCSAYAATNKSKRNIPCEVHFPPPAPPKRPSGSSMSFCTLQGLDCQERKLETMRLPSLVLPTSYHH